mgnify:CR=1 FL=1
MMRLCIKNASFKMHLSWFLRFSSLFTWHFLKKVLLACMGSTILKNDFEYFRWKISRFWPPNGFKMSGMFHYCSLLLLWCSFGLLCVRFLPPSKTACGSTPVLFSPPSPFCKNDSMHTTCNFMNFVCNLLFSLCISCSTHNFLQLVCRFFWKFASRPRWGAWFSKMHECKIMPKTAS